MPLASSLLRQFVVPIGLYSKADKIEVIISGKKFTLPMIVHRVESKKDLVKEHPVGKQLLQEMETNQQALQPFNSERFFSI